MAYDISDVFLTSVQNLRCSPANATNDLGAGVSQRTRKQSSSPPPPPPPPPIGQFAQRALSLRDSMRMLKLSIDNLRQLSQSPLADATDRLAHAQQMQQTGDALHSCAMLCQQLFQLAAGSSAGTVGRASAAAKATSSQLKQHQQAVAELLTGRMKALREKYDVVAERQKRRLELSSGLASKIRKVGVNKLILHDSSCVDSLIAKASNTKTVGGDTNDSSKQQSYGLDDGVRMRGVNRDKLQNTPLSLAGESTVPRADSVVFPDNYISETELQALEAEGEMMLARLTQERDEIQRVAGSISEIGRLNTLIADHLVAQEETTALISQNSVAATEAVRLGNENMREAMTNRSTMRFWLLFIVITLTLSLIFLDWYNP